MDEKTKMPNKKAGEEKEKKPFSKKIIISKEAQERQEKRRERIDGICKDFRSQKVPMNKPLLVENLLDFVYETVERKDEFAQFAIRKRFSIIL